MNKKEYKKGDKYEPGKKIEHGSYKWISENILRNERAFYWYKKKTDSSAECEHRHTGEPEKYPCVVFSEYDDYGERSWNHTFMYKEKRVCPECGHVVHEWPDEEALKDVIGL